MVNLIEGRAGFELLGRQYPIAKNVVVENTSIASIPCAWVIPPTTVDEDVVVYIHGGGFIYGSVKSHIAMVSYMAQTLGRKVLLIEYRLAPEHSFPGGLNDCVKVIETLCREHPHITYGIIGDSAGGNLVMATQLKLIKMKAPMPRYSIMISPWVDLECKNFSYIVNKDTDVILTQGYLQICARMYAGEYNLSDSLISPVNAALAGLPPALIMCGSVEILKDDSVLLHQQFGKAGVSAECIVFEGEQHVWPFMDINATASKKALKHLATYVAKYGVASNTF
ncbi:hypothetical protein A4H97_18055 [Niastella yeongjuensis]|uniref:Alpha/beta hydrolase fold-3 domain-containing protein n=1 Tax=Niastella yeongjuensis TaxID=354355 RepID=A0A1V9DXN1_9BACT|nr:alpha/beta hydrolase [Niastella yeongjuensis]OQP38628.1 hypothetical protein A4H97_18055 [Niastella yeongjuensis]SEO38927.1 Acetyl esterase/lipase [Niastella yeongjuensis]